MLACAGMATSGPAPLGADEVRRIVAEMLADAETRTSLSADAAGYDGRFFLADPASGFRLTLTCEYQMRYLASFDAVERDGDGGDDADIQEGFQLHNARLDFRGSTHDRRIGFRVMPAYSRSEDTMILLDAQADIRAGDWTFRVGQFSLPFTRDYFALSPVRQVAADRAFTDYIFRLNRSQGVMALRSWERIRGFLSFSDGSRALNTDFDDPNEADVALTGRIEGRLLDGEWRQFDSAFVQPDIPPDLLIGGAAHWQNDGRTGAPADFSGETDLSTATIDLSWQTAGWTAACAGYWRTIDGDGDQSVTDWGFMAHAAVQVSNHFDLFVRYSQVWPDPDRSGGAADFPVIELGTNWALIPGSQVARATAQILWCPEPQEDSASIVAPNDSIGILADADGGQLTFMIQFQLVF